MENRLRRLTGTKTRKSCNLTVFELGAVVINPHPKDLSKSPAVARFFVSPALMGNFLINSVK
jgi:hypothetical protein